MFAAGEDGLKNKLFAVGKADFGRGRSRRLFRLFEF
jgi:hypothetical protein